MVPSVSELTSIVKDLRLKNSSLLSNPDTKYLEMQSNITQISDDICKLKEVLGNNQNNSISVLNMNENKDIGYEFRSLSSNEGKEIELNYANQTGFNNSYRKSPHKEDNLNNNLNNIDQTLNQS